MNAARSLLVNWASGDLGTGFNDGGSGGSTTNL
jgi:hypothetical protein